MSFRKPFKAVPIKAAARFRRAQQPSQRTSARRWLLGAALVGCVIGTGTVASTPEGRTMLVAQAARLAALTGTAVRRAPVAGTRLLDCRALRAMGRTPIYRGQPEYRPELDADHDGIACEPVPKSAR